MKMLEKVFAVVLCMALIASCSVMSFAVSADEAKTVVDGIRWFPCDPDRQNDEIWEAECVQAECLCQRFNEDPAETGYTNFLATEYTENGGLKLTRTGADGQDFYWPRVRTLMMDNYPELDWTVANTLHFDIVADNCKWNVYFVVNGLTIKLGKAMAEATGATVDGDFQNSEDDAPAGTFVGSVNIQDALEAIANDGSPNAPNAMAIQKLKTTFVPQVQIFYVGGMDGTLTVNKLLMSTPDDVDGAAADHLDMGLLYGDEIYEQTEEEEAPVEDNEDTEATEAPADEEETEATEAPADEEETEATEAPADDAELDVEEDEDTTATTAAAEEEGGFPVWIIIVIAVVVVVAVVVIVVMKKKN